MWHPVQKYPTLHQNFVKDALLRATEKAGIVVTTRHSWYDG